MAIAVVSNFSVFSAAKVNLFLAITGRREDGFHNLVSLVAPVDFGDTLTFAPAAPGEFALTTDDPALAVDETNLILRAVRLFATTTGWRGGVRITLQKRIPMGAGLGGGSSNASATLRALDQLAGTSLGVQGLAPLAVALGSDCPLFLHDCPVVMRGRGECVEPLGAEVAGRVQGRRLLLFKPSFAIATAWAYRRLAAIAPGGYLPEAEAEARLATWLTSPDAPLDALFFNSLEQPAFHKFLGLPVLLDRLRERFGLAPRLSGSGSACFSLLPENVAIELVEACIREAWGSDAWVVTTRIR